MARNSQKIIQLLRSSQIYTPTIQYVNKNDDTDVITPEEYAELESAEQENYEAEQTASALENAIASFNASFVAAAAPQDGEIMLARYQETGEDVKAVLAAYTDKNNNRGFTFYLDSVAISDLLNELSEKIDVIEVKNSIDSANHSILIVPGDETTPTDIAVNLDGDTMGTTAGGALKGNYTLHLLTAQEIEALQDPNAANIKDAYRLQTVSGNTAIGDVIKIYKDSALVEIYLGSSYDTVDSTTGAITKYAWQSKNDPTSRITDAAYQSLDSASQANYEALDFQSLNYVYSLANGTYTLVSIDISKFLAESEFGAGLKVQGGVVSLDVHGKVIVGEEVTYVAIRKSGSGEKYLTQEEYDELDAQDKENYYIYENTNDPTDMLTATEYAALTPAEQADYQLISFNDVVGKETDVFNTDNGVVDVNAIQDAIDYASLAAAEGVRVGGSDSITVDARNTVYVRLSGETDNVLSVESGNNKGVYLSGTWDCGEY